MGLPTPTSTLDDPSHSVLHNEHANVKAFGAEGDGSTDDSAAIQDAIDSGAATIFFPEGTYRIGTSLVPQTWQHYVGTGGRPSTGVASILTCTGGNTTIVDCDAGMYHGMTWRGITFKDQLAESYVTPGTDTAFVASSGSAGIVNLRMYDCEFRGLLWSFDISPNAAFLINSFFSVFMQVHSPWRLTSEGFINDNHWINCAWNGVRRGVPAVDIGTTDSVGAGGGVAQGNYFANCYFESCDKQAVVFRRTIGGIRDSYFEAISEDATTYTTADGRTVELPWVDIQFHSRIKLDSNTWAGLTENYWGNSNTSAAAADRLVLTETQIVRGGTDDSRFCDESHIEVVDRTDHGFATVRGIGTTRTTRTTDVLLRNMAPNGPWTLAGSTYTITVDAGWADWFDIWMGDGFLLNTYNVTIANPTGATIGRRVTFEFARENAYGFGTITFGSKFNLVGGGSTITPPSANTTRRIISFYYNGQDWIETYRSSGDIAIG